MWNTYSQCSWPERIQTLQVNNRTWNYTDKFRHYQLRKTSVRCRWNTQIAWHRTNMSSHVKTTARNILEMNNRPNMRKTSRIKPRDSEFRNPSLTFLVQAQDNWSVCCLSFIRNYILYQCLGSWNCKLSQIFEYLAQADPYRIYSSSFRVGSYTKKPGIWLPEIRIALPLDDSGVMVLR